MNPAPSAEELMARVARRDASALEQLYDEYSGAALGLALRMLGDRTVAEEVVQESFWRVWRRAETFEPDRRFLTWLFSIVHHLAIDELRKRRGRASSVELDADPDQAWDLPDEGMNVEETAWSNVAGEQVRAAMARLPQAQRTVIELAYFEGLTHQEIADRLNEPLGTVHTRARLGLLKLAEILNDLKVNER